jgi:hypothetical protein
MKLSLPPRLLAAPLFALALLLGLSGGSVPQASAASLAACRADVNFDGTVSISDLATVAGKFLQSSPPPYDQNDDTMITITDLSLMASNFLQNTSGCARVIVSPTDITLGVTQSFSVTASNFLPNTGLSFELSGYGYTTGVLSLGVSTDGSGGATTGNIDISALTKSAVCTFLAPYNIAAGQSLAFTLKILDGTNTAVGGVAFIAPTCP